MAKAKKEQLKDIGITEKEAKHYGMAYSLQKELETTVENCKKNFKTEMDLSYSKIPDKDKCNYERSFTLGDIKFMLSIPMITNKEKLKDFLKNNLDKTDYGRAVTTEPVYELDRDKLKGNKTLLKTLVKEGVLIRRDDIFTINDNVVEEMVHEGTLVQADIDKECKEEGSARLTLSGAGLKDMRTKASKWIAAKFDL